LEMAERTLTKQVANEKRDSKAWEQA
jgi:hypothetical protein